ncbi:MAG TPA: UDP-4-amino-4,6-dideoxy-N-acetyl-beta-L-altrosamine transaminase [Alphaproteobacteria bacterium]|nr:UDP-4-amino-4,6-dideoxy-N-acetyl-beta-L-altrosamine transaminase [Alphaproteobacteria bacterium]HAJ47196.1 UDP-4-amino-4,6-dideoxy-N-acetyl-beta-L-altrosamine transaminase [Alphaproteobacteria bacterium]
MTVRAATPMLSYGRQSIDRQDIDAVVTALQADLLTTGHSVPAFEGALCQATGAAHTVAVCNGTAALHLAVRAAGLGPGTATIVPAITFVATANAVRLNGGEVIFADVDAETGLMTPDTLLRALRTPNTLPIRAVMPVHYAGPMAGMAAIAGIAGDNGLTIIEDACHAIGSRTEGGAIAGNCKHSNMTCFSFHPVKTITTGEGGAITTNDPDLAHLLRRDRSHGLTRNALDFQNSDHAFDENGAPNPWYYELHDVGPNYRLTDIQAALGISQLSRLQQFVRKRADLKDAYDALLTSFAPILRVPSADPDQHPAWHLYPVAIDFARAKVSRASVVQKLAAMGIGTQVHYIPVHLQPYYRNRYGLAKLPGAEEFYARTLSLPLHTTMTTDDVERVVICLAKVLRL